MSVFFSSFYFFFVFLFQSLHSAQHTKYQEPCMSVKSFHSSRIVNALHHCTLVRIASWNMEPATAMWFVMMVLVLWAYWATTGEQHIHKIVSSLRYSFIIWFVFPQSSSTNYEIIFRFIDFVKSGVWLVAIGNP